jgi:hypothetical protein
MVEIELDFEAHRRAITTRGRSLEALYENDFAFDGWGDLAGTRG